MMKTSRIKRFWILLLSGLAVISCARLATAQQVSREQDIVNLRLGQRVKVDDGTCPPGQIKEILGSKMAATGIVRTAKCVPRLGAKTSPTR